MVTTDRRARHPSTPLEMCRSGSSVPDRTKTPAQPAPLAPGYSAPRYLRTRKTLVSTESSSRNTITL